MAETDQKDDILDLVDIATLMIYEYSTIEPRFQHAKLRDVAYPGEKSIMNMSLAENWIPNARTVYVFDQVPGSDLSKVDRPENILPEESKRPDKLKRLTAKQLETVYYRARAHDGCFKAIALLQHFFDLYPPSTQLRIRHGPKGKEPGKEYITTIDRRAIVEDDFQFPKNCTYTAVIKNPKTMEARAYVCGHEPTMAHAIMGFSSPEAAMTQSFLDLSSIQFGDAGRGPGEKGKGLFALDTPEEFQARVMVLFGGNTQPKTNERIGSTPDDEWLKQVAQKVKERWEKREEEKWCGHCGGPAASKCSKCGEAWFCSKEHMAMAWPFHKGYCGK
ncbi:hypothetical protein BDV96DRAFT_584753 [Lophiotrema nucula]|uniref:MYND-type domain-containing protein n=1 Tax=Lophiotrema nucula TaxID=690887 RepID=A0A6A5YSA3_9PLEO|nr:hypothetical protein BDV96DRAFT_584753 [Lophiotrema nucula]